VRAHLPPAVGAKYCRIKPRFAFIALVSNCINSPTKHSAYPSSYQLTIMAERRYYGTIEEVIEPPNLIEVQSKSYEDYLQQDIPASQRDDVGLQAVFCEIFPIRS